METTECNNILILGGYSPLFVDLRDDFNQQIPYPDRPILLIDRPDDDVSDVPHATLNNLARDAATLDDFVLPLTRSFTLLYGLSTLEAMNKANSYLAPYREWRVNQ